MPDTVFPKHAAAVKLATADLGKGEVPRGSNAGPYVEECFSHTWLGAKFVRTSRGRAYWCVAAWQRWIALAGFVFPYKGAGAYDVLNWARAHGYGCSVYDAIPGDAVVFNVGTGHMAMLARKVKVGDRTVHTIDGNVSNQVATRERPLYEIRGCIHLPEQAAKQPVTRPAVYEVVTSASATKAHVVKGRVVYASGPKAVGRKLPELLRRFGNLVVRKRA